MSNSSEREGRDEECLEPMIRSDIPFRSTTHPQECGNLSVTIQTENGTIQVPISCEVETTLEDVGKQVWSGSILMCEYALRHTVRVNA